MPSTGKTTVFVYDAGGALAAEYSTVAPTNPTTSYLTTDHLGSPRVVTDGTGQVTSRRDFMPNGEELGAGVGGRTQNLKYSYLGSDKIRQRFTGYEKDDETGLDFAEARMYQNKHGRFAAPDPLLASASAADPQTFNRYVYTGNNPVNYTDPSGLNWCQQNGGTSVNFREGRTTCDDGWSQVDDKYRKAISDFSNVSNNGPAPPGSIIRFNSNGTVSVADPSNARDAAGIAQATGTEVRAEQNEIASTPASVAASGGTTQLPTAAAGPSLLPLCTDECNSSSATVSYQRIEAGAPKSVELIAKAAEACTFIPGLGTPCGIIAGIIRAGQGDIWGAGDNFLNAVPLVGLIRKADKAVDVADGAYTVYQGIDRTTGLVKYIGITSRDLAIREAEHKASKTARALLEYEIVKGAERLPKIQARVWEQKLINEFGLPRNGGQLLNKINSIAEKYWAQHGIRK